jgi:hypothetical protein
MGELQKAGLRVDLASLPFPLELWDRVSIDLLVLHLALALITYRALILDPCCAVGVVPTRTEF